MSLHHLISCLSPFQAAEGFNLHCDVCNYTCQLLWEPCKAAFISSEALLNIPSNCKVLGSSSSSTWKAEPPPSDGTHFRFSLWDAGVCVCVCMCVWPQQGKESAEPASWSSLFCVTKNADHVMMPPVKAGKGWSGMTQQAGRRLLKQWEESLREAPHGATVETLSGLLHCPRWITPADDSLHPLSKKTAKCRGVSAKELLSATEISFSAMHNSHEQ